MSRTTPAAAAPLAAQATRPPSEPHAHRRNHWHVHDTHTKKRAPRNRARGHARANRHSTRPNTRLTHSQQLHARHPRAAPHTQIAKPHSPPPHRTPPSARAPAPGPRPGCSVIAPAMLHLRVHRLRARSQHFHLRVCRPRARPQSTNPYDHHTLPPCEHKPTAYDRCEYAPSANEYTRIANANHPSQ